VRDLLFLSQRIPYPPNKGDKIRSFNILKHLSASFRIHLACFIDDPEDWAHTDALDEYCEQTHFVRLNPLSAKIRSLKAFATGAPLNLPYFRDPSLDDWVARVTQSVNPSAAFVFSSQMVQYLMRSDHKFERTVIDFCDVDSDKWRQYAATKQWPLSWLYKREATELLKFDQSVAHFVDAATFVAEPEVELFNRLSPETSSRISAVSNGIDCDYFDPDLNQDDPYTVPGPKLIFTGAMDYWPNIDSVQWFANDILPLVQNRIPDASFHIVGGNPSPDVTKLTQISGVFVTGRVPDMRPYFKHAALAVVPMRIARGIQNKVLEAMAMAKPTVVTPQALEGIDLPEDPTLYVADDAQSFADSCIDALTEDQAALRGARARQWAQDHYSWQARLGAYDALFS
jgi:sugar transferase (PEP-CTERM/EpsH1 system associated)